MSWLGKLKRAEGDGNISRVEDNSKKDIEKDTGSELVRQLSLKSEMRKPHAAAFDELLGRLDKWMSPTSPEFVSTEARVAQAREHTALVYKYTLERLSLVDEHMSEVRKNAEKDSQDRSRQGTVLGKDHYRWAPFAVLSLLNDDTLDKPESKHHAK